MKSHVAPKSIIIGIGTNDPVLEKACTQPIESQCFWEADMGDT
jgi:hypothetical protein